MDKIILIEDNNYMTLRLQKILKQNNIADLENLIPKYLNNTYLNSIKGDIKLFVVDLDTRQANGLNLIKKIHQLNFNNSPIIALSEKANVTLLKKVVDAGCHDFIIKPFSNDTILYRIKKAIIPLENHPIPKEDLNVKEPPKLINTKLKWQKNFIIHVDQIDQEHAAIIRKYEELQTHMEKGEGHSFYSELLDFLDNYVDTHFSNEEILHAQYNYPNRAEHHKFHEFFKDSIKELHQSYDPNNINDGHLIRISFFIKSWLIHHILVEDLKFGKYFKDKNAP